MTVTAIIEEASRGIIIYPPLTMTAIMSLGMEVTRLSTHSSPSGTKPARGAAAQLPRYL